MTTENYHNEKATFKKGERVQHVDDDGKFHVAHIIAVEGNSLILSFEDGDEGIELAKTCFHF